MGDEGQKNGIAVDGAGVYADNWRAVYAMVIVEDDYGQTSKISKCSSIC